MKKMIKKLYAILPACALFIGIASLNSACLMFYHQPEIPESLNNYRK